MTATRKNSASRGVFFLSTSHLLMLFLFFFVTATTATTAHQFQTCPNTVDHLRVSSLVVEPYPPRAGAPVSVTLTLKPDREVDRAKGVIVAKVLGVRVFQTEISICDYIACPLEAEKQLTLKYKMELPVEVPKGVELGLQVEVYDSANSKLSCISTRVSTYLDAATEAELEDGEKIHMLGATPNILESNGVITEHSLRFLFEKWLKQYHQTAELTWYPVLPSDSEDVRKEKLKTRRERLLVFAANVVTIIRHNRLHKAGKVNYAMALNQFGHMNKDEFAQQYLTGYDAELVKEMQGQLTGQQESLRGAATSYVEEIEEEEEEEASTPSKGGFITLPSFSELVSGVKSRFKKTSEAITKRTRTKKTAPKNKPISELPEEMDWVSKGAVNPVKNQGSCGSCWAFSAISALEGAYYNKYGVLKEFSEQQLVSCDNSCYGCGGGLMNLAFDFIRKNGGICTAKDYPYTSGTSGGNGFCRPGKCSVDPNSRVTSYVDVDHTEEALMNAIVQQPVSVAIQADQYAFQFYSHGVLTGECGDKLNHGVTAVGYGVLDGVLYWKLRNSWGANWGMEGYVLIQRGKVTPSGMETCGILANPSYPVL